MDGLTWRGRRYQPSLAWSLEACAMRRIASGADAATVWPEASCGADVSKRC